MATVQGIYVALFGRPADPAGLAFWKQETNNGQDLSLLVGRLTAEPEATARFEGLTNEQIVNSIYQSLFNRDGEAEGVAFFVGKLTSGEQSLETIAINILDGAQGTDKTIIDNKIAAADNWTTALDTAVEQSAYAGDGAAAAGRAFLDPVSEAESTIPTAQQTQEAIDQLLAPSGGQAPASSAGSAAVVPSSDVTLTADGADTTNGTNTEDSRTTTDGDDIINSTDDFLDESILDGQGGTDTLNVTTQVTISNFRDATFRGIEIINLLEGTRSKITFDDDNTDDQLTTINAHKASLVTATENSADITFNGSDEADRLIILGDFTGTFIGGGGADIVSSSSAADISKADITAETLTLGLGALTVSLAQHDAFDTINGDGTLWFAGAFDGTGRGTVASYRLARDTDNDFTLGAADQDVWETNGINTVNFGALQATGTLTRFDADDTAVIADGGDISGANGGDGAGSALGFGTLDMSGNVTMTAAQHEAFVAANGIDATGGSDQINIAAGDFSAIITDADVEVYTIGESTNADLVTVTVKGDAQQVIATSATDSINFTLDIQTAFTGILTGDTGRADRLILSSGDDVSDGAFTNIGFLSVTTAATTTTTYTNEQINAFGSVRAFGSADTAVITDDATITIDDEAILGRTDFENWTFNAQADVTVQMGDLTPDIITLTLETGGAGGDVVTLNNKATTIVANNYVNINNFDVGADDLLIQANDVAQGVGVVQGGIFVTVGAGSNTNLVAVVNKTIIAIDGTTVNDTTAKNLNDGGAVETVILAAVGEHNGTTVGNDGVVVLYGDNNAYIYSYEETSNAVAGALVQGDFEVELIAQLNGIDSGTLSQIDFI